MGRFLDWLRRLGRHSATAIQADWAAIKRYFTDAVFAALAAAGALGGAINALTTDNTLRSNAALGFAAMCAAMAIWTSKILQTNRQKVVLTVAALGMFALLALWLPKLSPQAETKPKAGTASTSTPPIKPPPGASAPPAEATSPSPAPQVASSLAASSQPAPEEHQSSAPPRDEADMARSSARPMGDIHSLPLWVLSDATQDSSDRVAHHLIDGLQQREMHVLSLPATEADAAVVIDVQASNESKTPLRDVVNPDSQEAFFQGHVDVRLRVKNRGRVLLDKEWHEDGPANTEERAEPSVEMKAAERAADLLSKLNLNAQ